MRRFALVAALAAALLASLPLILGLMGSEAGGLYLQQQTALDDQMVYAAWMRQAMDGAFLFDNRFAIESQPGLTFHAYFLMLGWLAKVVSIPWALSIARIVFSGMFVLVLAGFLERVDAREPTRKLAVLFAVFGGGLGFAAWEMFGREILGGSPVRFITGGHLPTDVWQPEAFTFPSMLTSGLFMFSLCLILLIFNAVLDARKDGKAVVPGMIGMLLLMNIHSYDVVLIALVLVGLVAAAVGGEFFDKKWMLRCVLIGLGAVPAALWFMHVIKNDPVFQARAATETFTGNFRGVLGGVLPAMVLAYVGLWRGADPKPKLGFFLALGVPVVLFIAGVKMAPGAGYMLGWPMFALVVGIGMLALWQLKIDKPFRALLWSWALMSLAAPYLPMLFQRKLSMGMIIPWAILAALALGDLLKDLKKSERLILSTACLLLMAGSSVQWILRELSLSKTNVSSTTLHSPYLSAGALGAIEKLDAEPGRKVVIASPAYPALLEGGGFVAPIPPDLNPIASGLTGAYSFAGHWSETPDYEDKRRQALLLFQPGVREEDKAKILADSGATHLIAPSPIVFSNVPLTNVDHLGEVIYDEGGWKLIRVAQ
jgi:arabinosyltransferase C